VPFRLVALDIDGTLLDPSGVVRPRVARAVGEVVARGAIVALATGRRLQSAERIARQLGISLLILTDGTVVYDLGARRVLHEEVFEARILRRAIDLVHAAGVPPILFESPGAAGRVLVGPGERDNPETVAYLSERPEVCRVALAELSAVERVVGILGMGAQAAIERLADLVAREAELAWALWRPSMVAYVRHTVTLAPANTSKGHALRWLTAYLGLATEQVLAVGDHLNDVSLLEAAGLGVAMGNAIPSVLAVAQEIVADNANDGVAEALERWVLAEKSEHRTQNTEGRR
jgi:hydroxymethylpyrimidine pyrophosphatase-like HAD family hydrolase